MNRLAGIRGISTIEALASLAIFAIVASGLSLTSVGSIVRNNRSKVEAQASALVQDKMEELRSLDPGASPPALTAGNHLDAGNPIAADPGQPGAFTRSWTVQRDSPNRGLAQVVVTVTGGGRDPVSVTGVTFLCTTRTCN